MESRHRRRRRVRRFLRKAGWPAAYVALVGVCLIVFLTAMHSCSREKLPSSDSSVDIVTLSK